MTPPACFGMSPSAARMRPRTSRRITQPIADRQDHRSLMTARGTKRKYQFVAATAAFRCTADKKFGLRPLF